ncbi:hypothetical protein [uncultured Secundilactobacillus sp.]|nr:hypothetical protein [uncultured Secundilactobacillus sp.]
MLELKALAKGDYYKAIDFAIEGMNFKQYIENSWARRLYGRYFFTKN